MEKREIHTSRKNCCIDAYVKFQAVDKHYTKHLNDFYCPALIPLKGFCSRNCLLSNPFSIKIADFVQIKSRPSSFFDTQRYQPAT